MEKLLISVERRGLSGCEYSSPIGTSDLISTTENVNNSNEMNGTLALGKDCIGRVGGNFFKSHANKSFRDCKYICGSSRVLANPGEMD